MINWQRDPRWVNTILGTKGTIGDFGCTISVIGNIIGVEPTVVNDRLKAVNGFANGNLVIWAKIEEAFPGIKIRRVWSYDNNDVKTNVPNVIVEVSATAIGGSGKHWVQFIGNQQCNDPWTGKQRPTIDFTKFGNPTGYCVITGKWNKPEVLEGLAIQVGYNPDFEGQDVTVNGVHYKAIKVDGKLIWKTEPPEDYKKRYEDEVIVNKALSAQCDLYLKKLNDIKKIVG